MYKYNVETKLQYTQLKSFRQKNSLLMSITSISQSSYVRNDQLDFQSLLQNPVCIAKWRLGDWGIQELPLLAASS